ncbi:hypothetical protein CCHL11_07762 [Colletotrichum chlorophyti]|uniref:Fucose-specific lectin n=1 Tax=Colletotrichum chlorophyti TaxID=708187 RepID=A0A1Q8RMZ8_9PEZI|nr:hypothetical protein CCHL11_07762 [Colletotrichum chlorophyti]
MQDPHTGNILHSVCNASTTSFPTDGLNSFDLTRAPRNGTAVAVAGWYQSERSTTAASLFYQAKDGSLVNAFYWCDFSTGRYAIVGEYYISETAEVPSIHNETGISVQLLGSDTGYRVLFHDENRRVNVLSYTPKTNWNYHGLISQDTAAGFGLTSIHSGQTNVSVIFPKDSANLEVSRFNKDDTWHLDAMPRPLVGGTFTNATKATDIVLDSSVEPSFELPAWSSDITKLGMAIDARYTRHMYYLGTDAKLHWVSGTDEEWTLMPDQSSALWPVADEANGEMAVVGNFDSSEVWVWYRVGGTMTQLYQDTSGKWHEPVAVPTAWFIPNTETASLSTGAKIGIGIGVSAGAVALLGVGLFFFIRRRRQRAAAAAEAARLKEAEAGGVGSHTELDGDGEWSKEAGGEPVAEADAVGTTAPQELNAVGEVHELVGEGHWKEMDATGQNKARRSIGGWREAQEAKEEEGQKVKE